MFVKIKTLSKSWPNYFTGCRLKRKYNYFFTRKCWLRQTTKIIPLWNFFYPVLLSPIANEFLLSTPTTQSWRRNCGKINHPLNKWRNLVSVFVRENENYIFVVITFELDLSEIIFRLRITHNQCGIQSIMLWIISSATRFVWKVQKFVN